MSTSIERWIRSSEAMGAGGDATSGPWTASPLRRALLVLALERGRHLAHEAVHLLLHLRVRLHADVEIEDHFGEAGRFDLLERVGDLRRRTEQDRVLGQVLGAHLV